MEKSHSLILNLSFLVIGLLFHLFESFLPERKLLYKQDFKKDLIGLLMIFLGGILISTPLMYFYQKYPLSSLASIHGLNPWLKLLLATLLTDFINYWIHYGMHQSNLIWKTHIHHHRIEHLYWFSGLRSSFTHVGLFVLSRVSVGVFLFQLNSYELLFYFMIGMTGSFYQHTNSKLANRYVEWIFMSPRAHRLHHSVKGRRLKNIGTIFSFWDRLFGTYLDPETAPTDYQLGIKSEQVSWRELIGF